MKRLPTYLAAVAALAAFACNAHASVAQDASAGLQDTQWQLVSIGLNPVTAATPTLHLGDNGSVGGSTGCNVIRASYTTDDGSLKFGPIGTTRKYCAAAFTTERAYVAMLEDVRGYHIDDGVLTLTGGNGETLAIFRGE